MKSLIQFTLGLALLGLAIRPVSAAFTSFKVFGDSLSSTTSNSVSYPLSTNYYGKRYSNGRVWVEVLAQQQGLPDIASNNFSYFGNYSSNVLKTLGTYTAPSDASNSLYVVWVNNADLFEAAANDGNTLSKWADDINQSQANHFKIITNLWGKGVRTLVMPSAVDVSTIPQFNISTAYTNTIHQQCLVYNAAFTNTINRALTNCPGLVIYIPDYYALLADLLAFPASYGVTNALQNGVSIDAVADPLLANKSPNGPGTNYIFWDYADPTAKVHYLMAGVAQQLISPAKIGQLTTFPGSNRLDLVNVPVYTNSPLNGLVLASTNLASGNWTTNLAFSTTNTSQSVWATNASPQSFYRLKFPYAWTWP